jgi:hypothetical protein
LIPTILPTGATGDCIRESPHAAVTVSGGQIDGD